MTYNCLRCNKPQETHCQFRWCAECHHSKEGIELLRLLNISSHTADRSTPCQSNCVGGKVFEGSNLDKILNHCHQCGLRH